MHKFFLKTLVASPIVVGLATPQIWAAQAQNCDNQVTDVCLAKTGWFVGGGFGLSRTDTSIDELNTAFAQTEIDANSINLDDSGNKYDVFAGFKFSQYFALSVGYTDLGDRELSFSGTTDNLAAFYDKAEDVYPDTGKGISANVLVSLPLSEKWVVTGKLGAFDWERDYNTYTQGVKVGSATVDGTELVLGAELGFHWRRNTQVFLGVETVELANHRVNSAQLGMRYFFGGYNKPRKSQVSPIKVNSVENNLSNKPASAIDVKQPKDSDNDGVYDEHDQCLDTPSSHQVDGQGCTIVEEKEHTVTLNVLFANDSDEIPASSRDDIAELAQFMMSFSDANVVIEGHTSSLGSSLYNQRLSERRAQAVVRYLVQEHSIEQTRLSAVGYGESRLLSQESNEKAHQMNRRIKAKITAFQKVIKQK